MFNQAAFEALSEEDQTNFLDKRDDRVREAIQNFISTNESEARALEDQARHLRRLVAETQASVRSGRWWELVGVILKDDIESLSNISPTDAEDAFLKVAE